MYSRKLSLTQARQYRTCPPPDIAKDPLHEEFFRRHLSICPYCISKENEGLKPWAGLTEMLKDSFSDGRPVSEKAEVVPGQLRFVKSELGTWHQGYYYNPPCILVLEKSNVISDDLQAAQIYHDIALAAPGDLIIKKEYSAIGDLFVECWNTYTLKFDYLGPVIGEVSPEIVEAVKKMEEEPEVIPEWAMFPRPLTDHDPRIYFRELEVEVGYNFACRAAEELMAELEGSDLELVYSTAGEVLDEIKAMNPDIMLAVKPATLEEALVAPQFPSDRYALAASDDDRQRFALNLVLVEGGRIKSFQPLQGEILQKTVTPQGRAIGGRVFNLPERLVDSIVLCFLQLERETLLPAESTGWDETTGAFLAEFDIQDTEAGELKMAVIYHQSR